MKPPVKIDSRISAGGQPSEDDLAALKASGVRTIINLRRPGEQNQPLDPIAEGAAAANLGLGYVHIPVDPKNLDPTQVDAVATAIKAAASGGVYIHCAAGGRACAHALLSNAKDQGHSADHVMSTAEQLGVPFTDEGFKSFIRNVAGPGKK